MPLSSFSIKLIVWYKKHARDLPWRRTRDPYKIWISEIMLQQTTVTTVIPYYEKWITRFPTVYDVAKARLQTILKFWQGLGYYSRAKNIHATSKIICQEYQGKISQDSNILKKLPGFGPYTTGAVLSIAYDLRFPIVDANVRRVIMRILAKEGLADTSQDKEILKFLDKNMPQKDLRTFNQALMELGALICRSKEPICLLCPLKETCGAYKKGIQEIIPQTKQKVLKNIDVVIGILQNDHKVFIQKRPSQGLLADLWEFPGGKIEPGETPLKALKREFQEELNIDIKNIKHFMNVQHFYTQYRISLQSYFCQSSQTPSLNNRRKWISLKDIDKYPMPSGSAKVVEALIKKFS